MKKEDKEYQRKGMEALSKEMYEGQVFMAEDEEKPAKVCQLQGCNKKIEGDNDRNKFCSRRHFYLDHHRRYGHSDQWRNAALGAAAILAISEMDRAEAATVERAKGDGRFFNTMVILVVFAAIVFYGLIQKFMEVVEYVRPIFHDTNKVVENERVIECIYTGLC